LEREGLNCNFQKCAGYSEKGQGHNKSYVYTVEGLFVNRKNRKVSFVKVLERWEGS
jgi:hypothetical protein